MAEWLFWSRLDFLLSLQTVRVIQVVVPHRLGFCQLGDGGGWDTCLTASCWLAWACSHGGGTRTRWVTGLLQALNSQVKRKKETHSTVHLSAYCLKMSIPRTTDSSILAPQSRSVQLPFLPLLPMRKHPERGRILSKETQGS